MIPRAKKNLHECIFHLQTMTAAAHLEDLEICFAAFVNSARSVTFILQKEYKNHPSFIDWYGDPNKYENGKWISDEDEPKNTIIYEMSHDELCKFFLTLRNQITKEGINGFVCSTHIQSFDSGKDLIDQPPNSTLQITPNGMYYLINKGTPQEDNIPAKTKGIITTEVFISNPPTTHLNTTILENQRDIISLSKMYYDYLKSIVEAWTGIINKE